MNRYLVALVIPALGACASFDPNADGAAYRSDEVTTGSNIPRKGTANTLDKSAAGAFISPAGGAPTIHGAGGS